MSGIPLLSGPFDLGQLQNTLNMLINLMNRTFVQGMGTGSTITDSTVTDSTIAGLDVAAVDSENNTSAFSVTIPANSVINNGIRFFCPNGGVINALALAFVAPDFLGTAAQLINKAGTANSYTTDLGASYNNGASGVGATLSASGVYPGSGNQGDRIIITQQTLPARNGVYILTDDGSMSGTWILTRATDFDSASDISYGDYIVSANFENAPYILNSSGPFIVGTTPINFVQGTAISTLSSGELDFITTPVIFVPSSTISLGGNSIYNNTGFNGTGIPVKIFVSTIVNDSSIPSFNGAQISVSFVYTTF